MFYQGTKEATVMGYNENNCLRGLVRVVIYSYGVRVGSHKESISWSDINDFVMQGLFDDKINSHIKGLLLITFSNINFTDTSPEPSQKVNLKVLSQIVDKSLEILNSFQSYDSTEDLFLVCEIFGWIIRMLKSQNYQERILFKLKKDVPFAFLAKLLSELSEMFILPKPHAFDEAEQAYIDDDGFILANEVATHDILHDVDVVIDSYKREIVTKIFKIFNIIFELKANWELQGIKSDNFPFLKEIMPGSPPKIWKEFAKSLQRVIIKWVNFYDEFEISSEIYDFLLQLEGETHNFTTENIWSQTLRNDISEDWVKVIPFFTYVG